MRERAFCRSALRVTTVCKLSCRSDATICAAPSATESSRRLSRLFPPPPLPLGGPRGASSAR
eukprot:9335402-Lingulodinium_polyedra.AAC.1